MKKAFTLAEAMVTMVVIGVIMTLAIPAIKESTNDTGPLFKKAYSTIEEGVNELINDLSLYPSGEFANNTFCNNFFDKLNTISTVNCANTFTTVLPTGPDNAGTPNTKTTNGMHWYGVDDDFTSAVCTTAGLTGECLAIQVDVNGPYKGPNTTATQDNKDIMTVYVSTTGKITVLAGSKEEDILLGND